MAGKKPTVTGKKVKNPIGIALKKEIVENHERGVRVKDLARKYGRSPSTICTILKNKDELKEKDMAKGVTIISKRRPQIIDEVEKMLSVWINEKQLAGDSVSKQMICKKAKALHADLIKKTPGTSVSDNESFMASDGWFEKFKRRSGIHSVVRHGEAASSDKKAAEEFTEEFKTIISHGSYAPQQVFNCDETGLFWKRMPRRTYITAEEKALSGHKPMKDRLTLLFCANASGDLKIKPMLVYHSETPRPFNINRVQKNKLPVMWRSNSKAWVTRLLFAEWVNEVFGPAVKKYLQEKLLPLKALLVMDNAPAHPPGLENDLQNEFKFIKVQFLPPNTTPLLQPMDQQVIANFKQLYTKAMFERCFEVTDHTNLTLKEFWKDHYNILNCIYLIDKAWQGVTTRCLTAAWRKLWPDSVPERDFEGFQEEEPQPVEEILSLGQKLGLEVDSDDVDDLLEEHREELTTDELQELYKEQQQQVVEIPGKEEVEALASSTIREACKKWEEVQSFFVQYHPDKTVVERINSLYSDNVVAPFRDILKHRQKQVTMDQFLVKHKPGVSDTSGATVDCVGSGVCAAELCEVVLGESSAKRFRRKSNPDDPEVILTGDSLSKK